MIYPARWVAVALLFVLPQGQFLAQQTSATRTTPAQGTASQSGPAGQAPKQESPVRLRTDEVVVDAIVTDKKNKPVMNLTADDFEVFEDGVKQRLASFRVQTAGQTSEAESGPAPVAANPASGFGIPGKLVAMVFDSQTTRESALLARKAALYYVDTGIGPNDFVGVFGIDQSLLILAPFTQDRAVLKRAIEAFTSRQSKEYNAVAGEVRAALEGLVTPLSDAEKLNIADTMTTFDAIPLQQSDAAAAVGVRATAANQIDPNRVTRTQILLAALRSLRTFNVYEKQFRALRVVDALLAIISGQSGLQAARKTLMFFSPGLAIPANQSGEFLSVISAANRAGITIYALDVAGLRVINPNEESMLERDAAAAKRIRNRAPELVSDGNSALGKMEDVARLNNLATLDELSEQTGGYTVKNTNDLLEGMRRILEGLGNYYVITYLSTNENYDGKFRRIVVKLKEPAGLQLRARQGYFGLRTLDNTPVMMSELPLLDRANSAARQTDFPLYAEAFHFRGAARSRQVAVYLQFPMSALKFDADEKAKTFSSRFAVLVLLKNESGVIVRKLGQEFSLRGPITQLEETAKKSQMYNRLVLLEPGKYTLDGVARDSSSGKSSVVHRTFEVPAFAADGIGVSSVVLSRGVNPLTEDQKREGTHPLYLEGQAYFVPNVSEVFSAGADRNVLVHFSVYPGKSGGNGLWVSLNFYKGGNLIAQSAGPLPGPESKAEVPYSTSFSLGTFPPGEYDLVVTATDASGKTSSSARFEVHP
jgi:VWFA-related protein